MGSMNRRLPPLTSKDRTKTELPALIALEAIGQPWFCAAHRCDLLAIGLVAQRLAPKGSRIHGAAGDLIALLAPDIPNLEALRPLVVEINTWLQVQPNGRIQAAIDGLARRQPGK